MAAIKWTLGVSIPLPPACEAGALPSELNAQHTTLTTLHLNALKTNNSKPPLAQTNTPNDTYLQLQTTTYHAISTDTYDHSILHRIFTFLTLPLQPLFPSAGLPHRHRTSYKKIKIPNNATHTQANNHHHNNQPYTHPHRHTSQIHSPPDTSTG